jgi:hypothetical protein
VGLIRKTLSASTLGAVDWKSDKERMAASARKTKTAAKKGNKLLEEQNALLRQQAAQHAAAQRSAGQPAAPTAPPAGWYDDPHGDSGKRWWDGSAWTEHRNS